MKKYNNMWIKTAVVVLFVTGFCVWTTHTLAASTNSWWLEWVTYTSRADWWADERMKYESRPQYQAILAAQQANAAKNLPETDAQKKTRIANEYVMKNFAEFFKVDYVIKNENGNSLWWNFQYANKKKILVHHTATTTALPRFLDEEKTYMQSVYKYHALSRWRWDIGYNFVIMPSGRIYEGRAGWAWVVGAHATWNNTDSIGIALVGNFQWESKPTQDQLDALVQLSTSLMKKYTINPFDSTTYFKSSNTYPYVAVMKNYAFVSHRDAGVTACPWENLYALLPTLRVQIQQKLTQWTPTMSSLLWSWDQTTTVSKPVIPVRTANRTMVPLLPTVEEDVSLGSSPVKPTQVSDLALSTLRSNYLETHAFTQSASKIDRLHWAPLVENIGTIQAWLVRVLLYEASQQNSWDITCSPICVVRYNTVSKPVKSFQASAQSGIFTLTFPDNQVVKTRLFGINTYSSSATPWVITLTNYTTTASNGVGLNSFRQWMLFMYGKTKDTQWNISTQPQLINLVSLDNYMKWIAEASDNEPQTKADLLALLSKAYAMYYMGGEIKHPSIPEWSIYNAIDDPRFFQKYLWYGWESISKKWPVALENTKDQYITYNNKLPILPYFHCSAWFTRTAQEKRGWQDTSYLQSVKDNLGVCESGEFEWHGVGLSGKWAAAMIANWSTLQQVLNTYYPGVTIVKQ